MTLNWMKLRPIYLLISGLALSLSLYAIFTWGFRYSIDFTGGAVAQYRTNKGLVEHRFGPEMTQEQAANFGETLPEKPELVSFEVVGPTLSAEILQKTYIAIAIASLTILLWVAYQFKSLKFGICAILAMIHDSVVLLGLFAALGYFMGVEVDILFVTAMLTILSFSVHDTIVVYDRVRESMRKHPGVPLYDLANKAVSETLVRSVNNSLTIIFMLFALFIMGGETIKWFIFALLVGTISGTYSSPFVAVPLLVTWGSVWGKLSRVRGGQR